MPAIKKGAKGKRSLKVKIVAGASAAIILVGFGIAGIVNLVSQKANENFEQGPEIVDTQVATETLETVETGTGSDSYFVPDYENEETVNKPTNVTDETEETVILDNNYNKLLSDLTDKAQAYCANSGRTSLAKMNIMDILSVETKESQVLLKGEFAYNNNTQYGNYIITLTNEKNKDLQILNLGNKELSVKEFVTIVKEMLNDEFTEFSLDARMNIIDFNKVDKYSVVGNMVKGLSNPDEIKDLKENVTIAGYSLLLDKRQVDKANQTIVNSVVVVAYTDKNVYASVFSFTSKKMLAGEALSKQIADALVNPDTNCTTVVAPTNEFEKMLFKMRNQLTENSVSTQEDIQETEALSRY